MQHHLISIITCFLNEERFLGEAIESVLSQDYPHWELLLIDDGSTDKSTQIAKDYAHKHPGKIFYYEHPGHQNKGLSASRNLAIQNSKGTYIAFLDGDDVWKPVYLTTMVNHMVQHAVGMVCEASEYWYDWNGTAKENAIIRVGVPENSVFSPPELMLELYPLGKGRAPCPCAIVLKKDLLLKYGGFHDTFALYEDQAFLTKFYLNAKVFVSSGCHNRYRQREGSIVHSYRKSGKYFEERKNYLLWLEEYLIENNIKDSRISKLLRKALFPYRFPVLDFILFRVPGKGKRLFKKISGRK